MFQRLPRVFQQVKGLLVTATGMREGYPIFFEEAAIVIEIIKEEVSEGVEDIDLDIFLTAVKFSRGCAIL